MKIATNYVNEIWLQALGLIHSDESEFIMTNLLALK